MREKKERNRVQPITVAVVNGKGRKGRGGDKRGDIEFLSTKETFECVREREREGEHRGLTLQVD